MGDLLSAVDRALRAVEIEDAKAAYAAKHAVQHGAGSVSQKVLAEAIALELTPGELDTYHAAKRELARIDALLAKVAHGAAKARIVEAKEKVASGNTDPEIFTRITNLRSAQADDKSQRRPLKQARLSVEATFAKALVPVAVRAKAAIDKILAELRAADEGVAKRFGLNWVPSATYLAVQASAEPTERAVKIGRVSLEYVDSITTPEARKPEPKATKSKA
jgi:hypothetical protein